MKVFTDGTYTFVAENLADVANVFKEVIGYTMEQEMADLDEWREVNDTKLITIRNVHDRGWDDKETKTAAEWAAENGRGLLCSTEW